MLNIYSSVKRSVFYIITHGCPQTIAPMIVLYHRFVPSEALLIINLDEKLSTINMYLLLLDKLYSLQLWSEQTRQINRHQLQKLLDEFTDRVFIYLPKTLSMQICPCLCGYSFTKTCSREVMTGSCRLVSRSSFSFLKN